MATSPATAPIGTTHFYAADIAAFCAVDAKTIRNWAAAGKLLGHAGPRGRIRFRAADVLAFLERYHYEVPEAVRAACPAPLRKARA